MDRVMEKLTILFEKPFWIGIFERTWNGKMSVAKVTFGAEPKDYEVAEFILKNAYRLNYSPTVLNTLRETADNPKRRQREIKKQLQDIGIGTKSQRALKLQQEQFKAECKTKNREKKKNELKRMFELKQEKKKEKHKGH